METTFWIIILLMFLVHPGYFFFLFTISRFVKREVVKGDSLPKVSFIIAAYNEEKVIKEKLENALEIDYPVDKIQIIVASDCSSDDTDSIVSEFADKGVILSRLEKRGGKTANQNNALQFATGEILVFSDAGTIYDKSAIKNIVRNFEDPKVGCVGGRLVHFGQKSKHLVSEKNYYTSFEQLAKTYESSIYTIVGVNGPIYAVRKDINEPLPESLTSDFLTPLMVIRKGFRAIYEPEAISYEEIPLTTGTELRRKIRTVRAGVTVINSERSLLNPFKHFWPSIFLFGHKISRWLFFLLMIGLFICNLIIRDINSIYFLLFILQILFYSLVVIAAISANFQRIKLLGLPYFFCVYNLASILGILEFLRGNRSEIWEVER